MPLQVIITAANTVCRGREDVLAPREMARHGHRSARRVS
jgi:hypothetical protein